MSKPLPDERFEAGKVVFRAGEMASEAYLVKKGQILIYTAVNGEEVLVGRINKGEIFGEMAVMDHRHHKYNAKAIEDSILAPVTREVLENKVKHADPLVRTMFYSAQYRLARTTERRLREMVER